MDILLLMIAVLYASLWAAQWIRTEQNSVRRWSFLMSVALTLAGFLLVWTMEHPL